MKLSIDTVMTLFKRVLSIFLKVFKIVFFITLFFSVIFIILGNLGGANDNLKK